MLQSFFVFPENISAWGGQIDDLFWLAVYLTGFAFLAVLGILVFCLVAYRDRPGAKAYYTHGDQKPHLMLTTFLSVAVFVGLDFQLELRSRRYFENLLKAYPDEAAAVKIEVRAEQFAWYFRYEGPDGKFGTVDDVVDPVIRIPVGKPVIVAMTSKDVIHSFFLPNMRVKQDAVPGIVTSIWFQATKTGDYEVACAELCGNGHTKMKSRLKVMEPEAFERWKLTAYQEDLDYGEDPADNWGWAWQARAFSGTEVEMKFNKVEKIETEHH